MKLYKIEVFFLKHLGKSDYEKVHQHVDGFFSDYMHEPNLFTAPTNVPAELLDRVKQVCSLYYDAKKQLRDVAFEFLSKDPYAVNFLNEIALKIPLLKEKNHYTCYRYKESKNRSFIVEQLNKIFADNAKSNKYNINYKFFNVK